MYLKFFLKKLSFKLKALIKTIKKYRKVHKSLQLYNKVYYEL